MKVGVDADYLDFWPPALMNRAEHAIKIEVFRSQGAGVFGVKSQNCDTPHRQHKGLRAVHT
jgi:hypothetical protein